MASLIANNYPTVVRLLNAEIENTSIRVREIAKLQLPDDRIYWRVHWIRKDAAGEETSAFRTEPARTNDIPSREILAKLRMLA